MEPFLAWARGLSDSPSPEGDRRFPDRSTRDWVGPEVRLVCTSTRRVRCCALPRTILATARRSLPSHPGNENQFISAYDASWLHPLDPEIPVAAQARFLMDTIIEVEVYRCAPPPIDRIRAKSLDPHDIGAVAGVVLMGLPRERHCRVLGLLDELHDPGSRIHGSMQKTLVVGSVFFDQTKEERPNSEPVSTMTPPFGMVRATLAIPTRPSHPI